MYDAPNFVKYYFDYLYKLNLVPVGTAQTENLLTVVVPTLMQQGFTKFFTAHSQYISRTSQYSKQSITTITPLQPPRFFVNKIDDVLLSRFNDLSAKYNVALAKLKDQDKRIAVVEQVIRNLEGIQEWVLNTKHAVNLELNRRAYIRNKIKERNTIVESTQRSLSQQISRRAELETRIRHQKVESLSLLNAAITALQEVGKSKDHVVVSALTVDFCHRSYSRHRKDLHAALTAEKAEKERLAPLQKNMNEALNKARQLQQIACTSLHIEQGALNMTLPTKLKRAFQRMPGTMAEMEHMIEEKRAIITSMEAAGNSEITHEYSQYMLDLKETEKSIENSETMLANLEQKAKSEVATYMKEMRQLIRKINYNFSSFLSALNFAGEVVLDCGTDKTDYASYGVLIKVKFRSDEPLKVLNAQHQSGGERSLATILYVFALQELSKVPFCCIDEINQGMDYSNERMVFELMFQLLSPARDERNRKIRSQYFMLTPKLLRDLSYGQNLRVWFVYNGPYMVSGEKWDVAEFCKRAIRKHDDETAQPAKRCAFSDVPVSK